MRRLCAWINERVFGFARWTYRWINRIILCFFALFFLYAFWLFGWVLWWQYVNPRTTRFMEIRLAEIRAQDPSRQLKKTWIDYDHVSIHLKRALIASEDSAFTQHQGFDWPGLKRAIASNERSGKVVAGGSTISQQLAKNLFLSPNKTPLRKLQEALITLMIEARWDKRRIFEVYINVIEWGDGVFGADAASRHYFNVEASRLTPEQAAFLASVVPRPRFYDQHPRAPELLRKTAIIQQRMITAKIP